MNNTHGATQSQMHLPNLQTRPENMAEPIGHRLPFSPLSTLHSLLSPLPARLSFLLPRDKHLSLLAGISFAAHSLHNVVEMSSEANRNSATGAMSN